MKLGRVFSVGMIGMSLLAAVSVITYKPDVDEIDIAALRSRYEDLNRKKMFPEARGVLKELVLAQSDDYDLLMEYIEYCGLHDFTDEYYAACRQSAYMRPYDTEALKRVLDYQIEHNDDSVYEWIHHYLDISSGEEYAELRTVTEDYYSRVKCSLNTVGGAYSSVSGWHGGYAIAQSRSGESFVLGSDGSIGVQGDFGEILSYSPDERLIAITDEEQLVYADSKGLRKRVPYDKEEKKLINYDFLGPFSDGVANIKLSGDNWGYIGFNGDDIILQTEGYEMTIPVSGHIGAVKSGGKWSFFSMGYGEHGGIEWLSSGDFTDLYVDELGYGVFGGTAYVKESGSDNWTAVCFDYPSDSKESVSVRKITDETFTEVKPFGQYGSVKDANGKWCIIDKNGTKIAETEYDELGICSCSLVPYRAGDKWGIADLGGRPLIEPEYTDITSFNDDGSIIVKTADETWRVMRLREYIAKENSR